MKAAVYKRYGGPDVVTVETNYPKPKITNPNQVLVKIHTTTVSTADHRLRALDTPAGFGLPMRLIFGITGPRNHVLGTELAGVVEAVGTAVTDLRVGDRIVAHPGGRFSTHAEYIVLPASACVQIPTKAPYREAGALAFGGTTALHFLRDAAKIAPGERLLVIGAAGCVGSAAVQIGKALQAHVTGVCSTRNVEVVRSLGADAVLDYTAGPLSGTYDVVMDCIGQGGLPLYKPLLATKGAAKGPAKGPAPGDNTSEKDGSGKDGSGDSTRPARLVLVAASLWEMLSGLWAPRGVKVVAGPMAEGPLLKDVVRMYEEGKFVPLLDERVFSLDDIVKAHALVDTGHKRGSVVIEVVPTSE